MVLESLTLASFAGRVGDPFRLVDDASGLILDAELVEATPEGEAPPGGGRAPFSLVFRAEADPALPQRIYRMDHAGLGSLDIFLVPIGPDSTGMRYQAIFA